MYADDTVVYFTGSDIITINGALQLCRAVDDGKSARVKQRVYSSEQDRNWVIPMLSFFKCCIKIFKWAYYYAYSPALLSKQQTVYRSVIEPVFN